jgi:hypothetical protein
LPCSSHAASGRGFSAGRREGRVGSCRRERQLHVDQGLFSLAILRRAREGKRNHLEEMLNSRPGPRVEGYSMLPQHLSQRAQHVGQRRLDLVRVSPRRQTEERTPYPETSKRVRGDTAQRLPSQERRIVFVTGLPLRRRLRISGRIQEAFAGAASGGIREPVSRPAQRRPPGIPGTSADQSRFGSV